MIIGYEELIKKAYSAFNARDIDGVLSLMHAEVQWANGWEGGFVIGHEEIRAYWTRQWKELNPEVKLTGFKEREGGSLQVDVDQVVKDLKGNLVFQGTVKHIYTFQDDLIRSMKIEKE